MGTTNKPTKGLKDIKELISTDFYLSIVISAKLGDPDWLLDIIGELDYIKPGATFYLKGFHGPLLAKGLTSSDFDQDALYAELMEATKSYDEYSPAMLEKMLEHYNKQK